MRKKSIFVILWLLVLVFCFPSISGKNEAPTRNLVFVNSLRAEITSPATVIPDEYFEVNVYVRNNVIPLDLWVDSITVQISGGGTSWSDDIASNREIIEDWEYNKTAVVKTFDSASEGTPISIRLEFNYVDRYRDNSYVHTTTDMEIARVGTQSIEDTQNGIDSGSSQYLIYLLLATTALFVATTIYFARRKPKID